MNTAATETESVVVRPEGWDYLTGGGSRIFSACPCPEPFTWGKVLKVHTIGDNYSILEYMSNISYGKREDNTFGSLPQHRCFHIFVRGAHGRSWDTHHGAHTLDKAIIEAIVYRSELLAYGQPAAANSHAGEYIARMLSLTDIGD